MYHFLFFYYISPKMKCQGEGARPQVELLRDSVSGNDSLCIGFDYPYYWGGKLPKEYEIYLKSAEAV